MNTYRIRANQTVTWYSEKTGRKMAPSTRLLNAETIQANSKEEALAAFQALCESRVSTDQKRDVFLSGTIYTVESPEKLKILSTDKF